MKLGVLVIFAGALWAADAPKPPAPLSDAQKAALWKARTHELALESEILRRALETVDLQERLKAARAKSAELAGQHDGFSLDADLNWVAKPKEPAR